MAHFDQEDFLQELGGVISVLHVEILGIVEGGEDRGLVPLFKSGPPGGFGTDDCDGAWSGAGDVCFVHDWEELDS